MVREGIARPMLAVCVLMAATAVCSSAQAAGTRHLPVVAGRQIGGIHVGETPAQIRRNFPVIKHDFARVTTYRLPGGVVTAASAHPRGATYEIFSYSQTLTWDGYRLARQRQAALKAMHRRGWTTTRCGDASSYADIVTGSPARLTAIAWSGGQVYAQITESRGERISPASGCRSGPSIRADGPSRSWARRRGFANSHPGGR
jgi:hypothetical protein